MTNCNVSSPVQLSTIAAMDTSEPNVDEFDVELSDEAWDQLAECLEQFSEVWEKRQARQLQDPKAQSFAPPNLEEFLPLNDPPLRAVAILELIKLDLEFRSANPDDDWMSLEQYREKWPEICVAGQIPSELVYEEFQIRKRLGHDSGEDEYAERFPDEFTSLSRLIKGGSSQRSGSLHTPSQAASFDVGDRVDDFDLLTRLGKGAFATVFLARQNSMQRIVALKISADEGREPQMLAQLDHPHIVRVYDQRVVKNPSARLMYMQHVAGGTLQEAFGAAREIAGDEELTGKHLVDGVNQLLNLRGESIPIKSENRRRLNRSTWAQVVSQIGDEIAQALTYAHSKNVLHRDLKPANVLLDKDCHVKLVDFNISFCSKLDGASPAAYFGGSMAYMSPEQLEACSPDHDREPDALDGRSDIFSAGVMLYELLVGHRPFVDEMIPGDWAGSMQKMIDARSNGLTDEARRKLEPFGSVLANTIDRCLQGNPEQRFQNAEAMRGNLRWAKNPETENVFMPRASAVSRFINWSPFATVGVLTIGMSIFAVIFISTYNLDKSVPAGAEMFFKRTVMFWANFALFGLGGILIYLFTRPISRVLAAQNVSQELQPDTINHGIRRNLRLGHIGAIMSCLEWSFGGMIYPTAFWLAGYQVDQQCVFEFVSSHLLAGLVTGAYVFWTVTYCSLHVWQPRLLESALTFDANLDWSDEHRRLDQLFGFYHLLALSVPIIAIAWTVIVSQHQTDNRTLTVLSLLALIGLAILAWTSKQVRYWLEILKTYDPKDDELD